MHFTINSIKFTTFKNISLSTANFKSHRSSQVHLSPQKDLEVGVS